MKIHPLAELFPPLEPAELQSLADDVKANGLREPIIVYDDKILDGRNRYLACERASVLPVFRGHTKFRPDPKWDDPVWTCPACGEQSAFEVECTECHRYTRHEIADPLAMVLSLNMYRRHLTTSQRAAVADKIASLPKGSNQHTEISAPSQADAAKLLNVSVDAVQQARQVREKGAPELVRAVERGEIAVSAAAKVAKVIPKAEQAAVVAGGKAAVKQVVSPKPVHIPRPTAQLARPDYGAGWEASVVASNDAADEQHKKMIHAVAWVRNLIYDDDDFDLLVETFYGFRMSHEFFDRLQDPDYDVHAAQTEEEYLAREAADNAEPEEETSPVNEALALYFESQVRKGVPRDRIIAWVEKGGIDRVKYFLRDGLSDPIPWLARLGRFDREMVKGVVKFVITLSEIVKGSHRDLQDVPRQALIEVVCSLTTD